ncbi:MAG: glycosyltransferase family 2 protein [Chloroflexi bacterium]|nr:glycosyltransferase family 2 protein [Chloroflexota bacterium]
MSERPHLSIVIPAYNEQHRLPASLERLREYLGERRYGYEVVVVDNASTDATAAMVQQTAEGWPQLRLLSIAERGKGIAVKVGALEAKGELVMLCDADFSMPADQIAPFLLLLEQYDLAIATREGVGSKRVGEPQYRHLMGRVFNGLVRFLAVPGFQDTQCGFKGFTRRSVEAIFPRLTVHGFGFDVEVLYLARRYGLSVVEVPIVWFYQADSRVDPWRDTLRMLGDVLRVRWNGARGQYG